MKQKMTLEKTMGLVLLGAILILFLGGYMYDILFNKVPAHISVQMTRAKADRNELIKIKCLEPRMEHEANISSYLARFDLLDRPENKYDVLDINESKDERHAAQKKEALDLKNMDEILTGICEEARSDTNEIQAPSKWLYFQTHWKELIF